MSVDAPDRLAAPSDGEGETQAARAGWRRIALGLLVVAALLGCWRLGTAWIDGVSAPRDFFQDYALVKGVLARENPYLPVNDAMLKVFGGPRIRQPLWPGHAPSVLPVLLPIVPGVALGSYAIAYLTWSLVTLAAFVAACYLTLKELGANRPLLLGVLTALALVTLPPIRESFAEGQLSPLVALGQVGCWVLLRRGKLALAGVSLGLAIGLSALPAVFVLYFAWRRHWRLVLAAAGALFLLSLFGLVLTGPTGFGHYLTVNYPAHAGYWAAYPDNASLTGLLARLFGPVPAEWPRARFPMPLATPVLAALAGGALAALYWRQAIRTATRANQLDLDFAAVSILALLMAPYIWPHDYLLLIAPAAILIHAIWPDDGLWDLARQVAITCLAVSAMLLSDAYRSEVPRAVGGVQLLALIMLFTVCLLAHRLRPAPAADHGRHDSLPPATAPA